MPTRLNNNLRVPRLAVVLMLAAGTAGQAGAQDALGTGHALDRNLRVGSGGINRPVNNLASDIAFRNAIVTGNVTGGFGFRGEVGYTGAFDFRESLGSDDIFDFQAQSFSSADVLNFHASPGMGGQAPGMRGLDATQRSLGWGVASQSPTLATGGPRIIDRQFSGASVSQIDQAIRDPLGGAAGITVDEFTRLQGAIRSTSDLIARSGSDVNRLGVMQDQQQGVRSLRVGSDLLAVRDLPIARREAIDGIPLAPSPEMLSTWRDPASGLIPETPPGGDDPFAPALPPGLEQRDPRELLDPRLDPDDQVSNRLPTNRLIPEASPYRTAIDSLRVRNDRIAGLPIDNRANQPRPTEPASEPATEPADPGSTWALTLDQRLEAIRMALQQDEAAFIDPSERMQPNFDALVESSERAFELENLRAELRDLTPEERQARLQDPDFIEAMADPRVAADIAREALAGSGIVVRSLVTRPQSEHDASVFEQHMRRGQELLAEGSFFGAEERFTAALFIVPGDPLAAAGRINAQIGAGMYRSATLNLRTLLRDYPELAAVRFDPSLLPQGERLETTLDRLRERTLPDTPVSQDAGLLLAYLGHQFGNQADIRRGIDAARKVAEETDRPLNPLIEIVAAIWLADGAPPADAPPSEE